METAIRTVVLDASAAIALLRDEPGGETVSQLLRSAKARMSVVNAAETVDVLVRTHGRTEEEVVVGVEQLLSSGVEPVPASLELATRAGELRARLHNRSRRISLADCFLLATAEHGDSIVTTDEVLAAAARDEGIEVTPLR